jgi:cysteinyl-tRNA synthetase
MHSAWVTQSGEKMSKSLGTGLSVDTVLADHSAWVIRYALASVHYRSMLEWSDQTLNEAESAYERISNFINNAEKLTGSHLTSDDIAAVTTEELPEDFVSAMNDDINVSNALAAVFSTIRQGNSLIAEANGEKSEKVEHTLRQVRAMLDTFGLDPLNEQWVSATGAGADSKAAQALDTLISSQLEARAQARKNKDFAQADAIRDSLAAAGIEIADSAQGSSWHLN